MNWWNSFWGYHLQVIWSHFDTWTCVQYLLVYALICSKDEFVSSSIWDVGYIRCWWIISYLETRPWWTQHLDESKHYHQHLLGTRAIRKWFKEKDMTGLLNCESKTTVHVLDTDVLYTNMHRDHLISYTHIHQMNLILFCFPRSAFIRRDKDGWRFRKAASKFHCGMKLRAQWRVG